MEVILGCCAGLDIHKDSVEACVRRTSAGGKVEHEVRHWGTTTRELVEMSDWLSSLRVTHVAMESTGVCWKPIFNILEERFEILLADAHHLKNVPGRKTDIKDCQWIAQLLQHGLLRGSFIPPRPQRELRDLTRQRTQLVDEASRISNRIQKVLEDANVKLGSVASNLVGASGRLMLEAIVSGQDDPAQLADLAKRRLRAKIPQLEQALYGKLTEHHRWMLGLLLDQLKATEQFIVRLDERIAELTRPQLPVLEKLDAIPGVDRRVAEVLLAEIGPDVTRFRPMRIWPPGRASARATTRVRARNAVAKPPRVADGYDKLWCRRPGRPATRRTATSKPTLAISCTVGAASEAWSQWRTHCSPLSITCSRRAPPIATSAHSSSIGCASKHLIRFHVRRLQSLGLQINLTPEAA